MDNYRVVCINSKKRPSGIPITSWIEEGEVYTVIHAANMARQRMTLGYKLAEVQLPEGSDYEYYAASRFRPYDSQDAEAESAVEELLMEELELQSV
jgi:hypothetical protein